MEAIFRLYDPNNTYHQVSKYEAVCFDMEITFFDEGHADGKNTIGFHIKMERIIQPFIWKYYIPCIAIVLVSGLSFIIPLSAIPGRVALLVTQFLSLINLFIFQMVSWKKILSSFKSNYIKRVNISSMSLQEYAYVSILVGKPFWNTTECLGNIFIVISCLCCCCTD